MKQLSRQKAALAEELIKSRKELERQSDTIVRIAKEKEDLNQDKAELAVQLTASERENRYVLLHRTASVKSSKYDSF